MMEDVPESYLCAEQRAAMVDTAVKVGIDRADARLIVDMIGKFADDTSELLQRQAKTLEHRLRLPFLLFASQLGKDLMTRFENQTLITMTGGFEALDAFVAQAEDSPSRS